MMDAPKARWTVRELLKKRGWSQADLCEATKRYDSGVAEQTIKNICANGARGFTLSIIGILAAVLECGVEDLIDPGKVRAKGA
jgi:DNA-binding Xre family transcriptional regulator